jgi:hypothetical protein
MRKVLGIGDIFPDEEAKQNLVPGEPHGIYTGEQHLAWARMTQASGTPQVCMTAL